MMTFLTYAAAFYAGMFVTVLILALCKAAATSNTEG
jgi:hypothetical protein